MQRVVLSTGTLVALCCVVGLGPAAIADRGGIHPVGVNVQEPAQRAIIAHGGARQILILQTDIVADRDTTLVEFMPLPAKPEVSLAPAGCFAALADIVEKHGMQYLGPALHRGGSAGETSYPIEVVVEAQLGPHGVTVIHVKDAGAFVEWVEQFFQEKGLGQPFLPQDLAAIVAGYCERDIRYFAFDVLDVTTETQTVSPLTYAFESSSIYYPLVVSNLYGDKGIVELFVVVPEDFTASLDGVVDGLRASIHPEVRETGMNLLIQVQDTLSAYPTDRELSRLHEAIPKALGSGRKVLRAFRYRGKLSFAGDLSVPMADRKASAVALKFVQQIRAGELERALDGTSMPFFPRGRRHEDAEAVAGEIEAARNDLDEGSWEVVHTSCHRFESFWDWIGGDHTPLLSWVWQDRAADWWRLVIIWLQERATGKLLRWTVVTRAGENGVRVAGLRRAVVRLAGTYDIDTLQLVADTLRGPAPKSRRGSIVWQSGAEAWARRVTSCMTLERKGQLRLDVGFEGRRSVLAGRWAPRSGTLLLTLTHADGEPLEPPVEFEAWIEGSSREVWAAYRLIEAAERLWGDVRPFVVHGVERGSPDDEGPLLVYRRR